MNASARKARRLVNERRDLAKGIERKRLISAHVARATADTAARKTVTAALQKAAKPLREAGDLDAVKTRVCAVADGVRGKTHRYTASQVAKIAAQYNPRKAEGKAAKAALLGA